MSGYVLFEYAGLAAILIPCLIFITRRARRLVGKEGGCGGCSCSQNKSGSGQCG